MCAIIHHSVPLFVCCGLLGVLSAPPSHATTLSPTTTLQPSLLNDTNSSLLASGEDSPVILAEGDVDVLILNLGGILNEEELNNGTDRNNASLTKLLSSLGREIEAVAPEEESFFVEEEGNGEPVPLLPASNGTTKAKNPISTSENNSTSTGGRKKRSNIFSSLSSQKSSTEAYSHTTYTSEPASTKTNKRSITNENLKPADHELDKYSHKTDPTLSKIIGKRSDYQYGMGSLFPSHSSTEHSTAITTSSSLSAKDTKSTPSVASPVIPTFQSIHGPVSSESKPDHLKTLNSC